MEKRVIGCEHSMGILTLLFIILRAANIVQWSWAWVFSPVWIPLALCGMSIGIVLIREFYCAANFYAEDSSYGAEADYEDDEDEP